MKVKILNNWLKLKHFLFTCIVMWPQFYVERDADKDDNAIEPELKEGSINLVETNVQKCFFSLLVQFVKRLYCQE